MTEASPRLPRVLFAVGGLDQGGSENQLLELIRRTHGQQLDAALMTFARHDPPEREAELAALGVRHLRVASAAGPRAIRPFFALPRIARRVRALRPDLVYPWLEAPATALAPVARAFGIPLVIARRNLSGANVERYPPVRWAIRLAERSAALVTGNSEAVLEQARARGIRPEKLRLVRNGHVVLSPLPEPEAEPVVIGYVANYRGEKGHPRLLAALEQVQARTPWRVDLAGSGGLCDEVAADIRRRGLEDRVRMVGTLSDPREFWRERHVAALLSDHEGSPNALIEAALCGRPMLGTRVGGTQELIPESAGLLVPCDDTAAIARAIERLVHDEALRARLGADAFEHAAREYEIQRFVQGHLRVIEEALHQ